MLQSTITTMANQLATISSLPKLLTAIATGVVTSWLQLTLAAVALLSVGVIVGYLLGRLVVRNKVSKWFASSSEGSSLLGGAAAEPISQRERERMLELLHEIGSRTNEYGDKVSQYQNELGDLEQKVNQDRSGPSTGVTSDRIVNLLQQFMQNSGQLQQRLDAAETQLDLKTRQIASYLTEARTDSLTGLFNRRAFDQRLDELFMNYRRGGRPFVVALVDVDHFKKVNDSHGHQIGDRALQEIAGILHQGLSDTLMVARFGGEEFAVIMDGPLAEAAQYLDQVRKDLHRKGLSVGGIKLDSTISVGLSEPSDDTGAAPLVRRADEALYAAKNFGRNRVYFHDGKTPTLVGAPETARNP